MTDWKEEVYQRQPYLRYRDHSYWVQANVPVGSHVRLVVDVTWYQVIPAGTTGIITSYSNAGFRGIEASIHLDTPLPGSKHYRVSRRELGLPEKDTITDLYGISAGKLEKA